MANLKRFGLHLMFAAMAAILSSFVAHAAELNLPPEYTVALVAAATAAASFFRAKGAD